MPLPAFIAGGIKLGGVLLKGAKARTLATSSASLTKRLAPPMRPPPPVRQPLDTIIGGRVGPFGGAITRQRYGPPPVRQSSTRRARRGIGVDQNGQEYLLPGYMIDRNGNIRKRPSMNTANPRAAVRALRRVKGFEKIARQIIKVTPKFKSKPTFRGRKCK